MFKFILSNPCISYRCDIIYIYFFIFYFCCCCLVYSFNSRIIGVMSVHCILYLYYFHPVLSEFLVPGFLHCNFFFICIYISVFTYSNYAYLPYHPEEPFYAVMALCFRVWVLYSCFCLFLSSVEHKRKHIEF